MLCFMPKLKQNGRDYKEFVIPSMYSIGFLILSVDIIRDLNDSKSDPLLKISEYKHSKVRFMRCSEVCSCIVRLSANQIGADGLPEP